MQLTEEQHQLVEAAQGQPVEVVDPRSQRAYILVPADLYQRVRPLLPAVAGPSAAGLGEGRREAPLRIKLRELPTPPEVAARARRRCKELGLWRRRYVQELEDELRFQYHFGGQYIAYLKSKDGPIIVAAGRLESESFGRQLDALPSEERRKVIDWLPPVWNDTVSELLTPFDSDD